MKVITDDQKINSFLERGVSEIYPNREFLKKRLNEGKALTMYLGIDPSGDSLHLGHSISLRKLGEFQKLGHKAVLLIGDFTAMIGDPTGKSEARNMLTREQVLENAKNYKKQASNFLDFEGDNPAEIKHNSEWLSKMTFEDVVDLSSKMTVQEMLKRDMFEKRMEEEKPIYIHEFLYPLMQGYDAVAMKTDGEIGGNDQIFNMLVGRTLMKKMISKEKFVMAMKLLEDPTGAKMGKSEGNMIRMDDSPESMFGGIMSWPDEMIIPGFELLTNVSAEDIEDFKNKLDEGENPKDIKMALAREVVSVIYGPNKAKEAQKEFEKTFVKGGLPENIKEVKAKKGAFLGDVLVSEGVIDSKTEFRRLIDQGAIKIVEKEGESPISDYESTIERDVNIKVGKRRFLKIVVK